MYRGVCVRTRVRGRGGEREGEKGRGEGKLGINNNLCCFIIARLVDSDMKCD